MVGWIDKSEATARLMFDRYVALVSSTVGEHIEAVLLLGSLATGSYVPGPGDIDQVTIFRDSAPKEAEESVLLSRDDTMAAFGRAINISTVAYRRSQLVGPWTIDWDLDPATKHLVTVPEELLRIHDHGRIVYGTLDIQRLPIPSRDEMIAYHTRWRGWNEAYQRKYGPLPETLSARLAVQSVLSKAIWHYYFATGRTCFNKHTIARRLKAEVPGYSFLDGLLLATSVRLSGFANVSDETLERLNTCHKDMHTWARTHPVDAVPHDA